MSTTTMKVSKATRDRIKALGGATHEETVCKALDLLEAQQFWQQAERAHAAYDALPADVRAAHEAAERKLDEALDSIL